MILTGGITGIASSHPAWGAWIEMDHAAAMKRIPQRRTPHGVRGLKLYQNNISAYVSESHPAWGAWIEI